MSMYPFYFGFERPRLPRHPMDQHIGLGMTPQDYLRLLSMPAESNDNYNRSRQNMSADNQDVRSTMKQDNDKFQINIDAQHFRAEEMSVKVVDGFLIVEGKHDERADCHGFISRNFTRRYPLPEGVNPELVVSKLSSNGVLTIMATGDMSPKNSDERIVPIVQTGRVKKRQGGAEQ